MAQTDAFEISDRDAIVLLGVAADLLPGDLVYRGQSDHACAEVLILLAKARAAESQHRDHFRKTAYLQSPADCAEQAGSDEQTTVQAALDELATVRGNQTPEDMAGVVIKAFYDFEVAAFAREQAASQFRQERQILCDADDVAALATDKSWVDLLLAWATPGRSGQPSSLSSEPPLAPERIERTGELETADDAAGLTVWFKCRYGGERRKLHHSLRRTAIPMYNCAIWRISKIEAGDDGDRHELI